MPGERDVRTRSTAQISRTASTAPATSCGRSAPAGRSLGDDADRYGNGDVALDLEAVRQALGIPLFDVYASSYGNVVAQAVTGPAARRWWRKPPCRCVTAGAGTSTTRPRPGVRPRGAAVVLARAGLPTGAPAPGRDTGLAGPAAAQRSRRRCRQRSRRGAPPRPGGRADAGGDGVRRQAGRRGGARCCRRPAPRRRATAAAAGAENPPFGGGGASRTRTSRTATTQQVSATT